MNKFSKFQCREIRNVVMPQNGIISTRNQEPNPISMSTKILKARINLTNEVKVLYIKNCTLLVKLQLAQKMERHGVLVQKTITIPIKGTITQ